MLNLNYAIFGILSLFQTGDDSSGFELSDNYTAMGWTPNTQMLVISYMFMAAAMMLYLQFGISFIARGRKSESPAQRSYYIGLGMFILTVLFSEMIYLIDLLSRDINNTRFFLESSSYPDPFESFLKGDYFIVDFFMILVGLAFLMYPMEKYLYAQKTKTLTIAISCSIPLPLILRVIEINHTALGLDLSEDSGFHYQLMTGLWIFILLIGVLGMVYLLKLYVDLGRKAPEGSKLRSKSRQIILGLIIWITGIFSTSTILKEISDVGSSYGPHVTNAPGTMEAFVQTSGLYPLFPFFIPSLLVISIALLVSGFTRDY